MFYGAIVPRIDYRDPWNEPLEERVCALLRRGATRRVAYLYERPDTSTFRYRVFNMIEALGADGDTAAAWFSESEVERLLELLSACDLLVICRARYSSQIARLLARAQTIRVTTIFDVDDLVFDTSYIHLLLDTLDQAPSTEGFDWWFAYIGRIGATMRLCDRIMVTNSFLAEKAANFAPTKDVRVIPNFLNRRQLEISDDILERKRIDGFARNDRIHLGYFSGTPSHNRDFLVVADGVAQLLGADPRLVLRLVGFLDLPPVLARFADRVERFPLQDFLNLQRLIGETELNLVPLRNNAFTNCKSELKYFEAAIVGTCTIASPTFVFGKVIQEGTNGWIATSHEWGEKIAAAVSDWDRYAEVANAAAAHARQAYAPAAIAGTIETALFGEPSHQSQGDEIFAPPVQQCGLPASERL